MLFQEVRNNLWEILDKKDLLVIVPNAFMTETRQSSGYRIVSAIWSEKYFHKKGYKTKKHLLFMVSAFIIKWEQQGSNL